MSASTPSGTPGAEPCMTHDEMAVCIAELAVKRADLERQNAALVGALDYALDTLEKFYVEDCECEDCNQCDKLPQDCTGTECARTCQCNECRYCHAERALESGGDILKATRTALRASEGGPETGGAS